MYFIIATIIPLLIGFGLSNAATHQMIPYFLHPNVPVIVLIALLIVTVIGAGIVVRRYKQGDMPSLTGVGASYILAFSRACLLSGISLTCLYAGMLLGSYEIWNIIFSKYNSEVVAILTTTALIIASLWTIEQCKINSNDIDSKSTTPSPPLSQSAI